MKKTITRILIVSIICTILTAILCILACKYNRIIYPGFKLSKEVVNGVNQMDGGPGAGEYLLIVGSVTLVADTLGNVGIVLLYGIIGIVIPFVILFLILVFNCIARLVQIGAEKKSKNKSSKTLTWIAIVLNIVLCIWLLLISMLGKLNIIFMILNILLNIGCTTFYIKSLNRVDNEQNTKEIVENKEDKDKE